MEKLHLETPRLIIRHLDISDLEDFHLYRSNPEVTKYQGFDVMNMNQAERFIKTNSTKRYGNTGEWVQYGIENRLTKKLIGDCAIRLHPNDRRIAEIGMTISHLEQKKGFAKESFLAILKFLFDEKALHRVQEIVDAENTASINLLKSLGFREEGYFIENIFFKGKWGSEYQYALLKSEWDKSETENMG